MPRLRQAVIAAWDLKLAVAALRERLGLGEPYRDPAVAYFGLANAVFCVGDAFLEIVSPVDRTRPGAQAAARRLERSGAGACGYMAMVQVEDLAAARARASELSVREVFQLELDDIAEVHLHPADVRGCILALSQPSPPDSWRWGGQGWRQRSVPGRLQGIDVAVDDPAGVAGRWDTLAGGSLVDQCRFVRAVDHEEIVEIRLQVAGVTHGVVPAEV